MSPSKLKDALGALDLEFNDIEQKGVVACSRAILNSLHEVLIPEIEKAMPVIDSSLDDEQNAMVHWAWINKFNASLVKDIFGFQMKSTRKCNKS